MLDFKVTLPVIPDAEYNIKDYGAVNGGVVSNTEAIQKTIDTAAANGGGKVIIPAGIWLSGPIRLQSKINLHVETGAVLLFSKNDEEYPLYWSDYEGMPAIRTLSPIMAENVTDIAITGNGTIDGNGQLWRPVKQFKMTARQWDELLKESQYLVEERDGFIWMPTKSVYDAWLLAKEKSEKLENLETAKEYYDFFRPVMVHLYQCKNILIEDITLQNSPAWNVHPCFCEHVTIRNAKIRNPYYAQNGDGLDLESCKYAEIIGTTFDVGDDAICMKSGKGAKARQIEVPTEYVRIQDCTVYHGHGGFVVGSEMSRGIRHVEVKNCSFIGTDVGIRFKSAMGRGGVVEDILLEDIQMMNIEKEAIIFTMGYVLDYRESGEIAPTVDAEDVPYFKNIHMNRIICNGADIGLKVEGLDLSNTKVIGNYHGEPAIDEISVEDSYIVAKKDVNISHAGRIVYENHYQA